MSFSYSSFVGFSVCFRGFIIIYQIYGTYSKAGVAWMYVYMGKLYKNDSKKQRLLWMLIAE